MRLLRRKSRKNQFEKVNEYLLTKEEVDLVKMKKRWMKGLGDSSRSNGGLKLFVGKENDSGLSE